MPGPTGAPPKRVTRPVIDPTACSATSSVTTWPSAVISPEAMPDVFDTASRALTDTCPANTSSKRYVPPPAVRVVRCGAPPKMLVALSVTSTLSTGAPPAVVTVPATLPRARNVTVTSTSAPLAAIAVAARPRSPVPASNASMK